MYQYEEQHGIRPSAFSEPLRVVDHSKALFPHPLRPGCYIANLRVPAELVTSDIDRIFWVLWARTSRFVQQWTQVRGRSQSWLIFYHHLSGLSFCYAGIQHSILAWPIDFYVPAPVSRIVSSLSDAPIVGRLGAIAS